MNPTKLLAVLAGIALLAPASALAGNVQGNIVSNTTWTLAGSPYTVVGDVTVPAGVTLTIEPGAQVTFANGDTMAAGTNTSKTELIISGTLNAQGTSSQRVTLNAVQGYGVRVLTGGGATLDYTDVSGSSSYFGVYSDGTLNASNSTFTGGSYCLRIQSGTATVTAATISGCGYGVGTYGGTTNVSYSVLRNNSSYGAYVGANTSLVHNTIADNPGSGVYVTSFTGSITIKDNSVTGNGSYGIGASSASSPSRTVSNNNTWGSGYLDLSSVSGGAGAISENPLYLSSTNYTPTENSPLRMGASDGTDIGAFAYAGNPTPDLRGVLFSNRTLTGANTVTGDLTVRPGVTLTLAAGATLTFANTDAQGAGTNTSEVELIVAGTFNAQGAASSRATINAAGGYGLRVLSGGSATVDYTDVSGNSSYYGVYSEGTFTASNSTFSGGSYCVRVQSGNTTLTTSTLASCGYGFATYGGSGSVSYSVLRNNSSYGAYLAANGSLVHNTIADNPGSGVYVSSFSGSVTLKDNAVTSNGSYGIGFSSVSAPSRTVSHNDVWGSGYMDLSSVSGGTGAISANPIYVSSTNYTPTENSPLRMAASDGTDIGAFAYAGNATPDLRGVLYTSRTLTGANTLTGDLTVRAGVTLTLAAGATLTFATSDAQGSGTNTSEPELIVAGTFDAQGSASSRATINATQGYGVRVLPGASATLDYTDVSGNSSYYGIYSEGTLTASNASFSGGSYCLRVQGGTATVTAATIANCGYGVGAYGGTTDVSYSVLRNNSSYGAYLAANGSLVHSTIADNPGSGVYLSSFTGSVTIKDNSVTSNGSYGIGASSASSPSRTVSHNNAWGNGYMDLSSVSGGAGAISANPIYVGGGNYKPTENSPLRMAASDGTEMGAFPWTGDPTPDLRGVLFTSRTLTGANSMTGDLTVRPGVTLTLAAGATLTFANTDAQASGDNTSEPELIVAGTFDSQGSAASRATINAAQGYGVRVLAGGSATLDYTDVSGNSSYYGIYTEGTFNTSNSTFSGGSYCVRVQGGTATVTAATIANCGYGVGTYGGTTTVLYSVLRNHSSYGAYAGANTSLVHNTIADNPGSGVYLSSFSGSVTIQDNSVTSNGSYGIGASSASSPSRTVSHNNSWGNGYMDLSSVSGGTGAISANPIYVGSGNYKPTENSPLRLAASDGTDIGAFGYTGDPTPDLRGVLFSSRTLTGANTMTGDLTVRAGVTLTLAAGATLTFANTDAQGSGINTSEAELIVAGTLNAEGTAASRATINGAQGYGVRVLSAGSATLDYTDVSGNGSYYGVYTEGTFTANNSSFTGGSFCVRVQSGNTSINAATIANCSYGLGTYGGSTSLTYSLVKGSSNYGAYLSAPTSLIHNTIADNPGSGVYLSSFSGSVTIKDNIVTDNGNYGIAASSSSSPSRTVSHNDVWNNSYLNFNNVSGGTGALSINPLYVSPGFNYTLQASSPCRNAASDGTDMGAFPYVPVPVAYVTISPATSTVSINGTQQFTATAYDAANNPLPNTTFVWSASSSAGTINPSGLFTAGCTPGTYTGAVTVSAGGKSATANVTINAGPPATVTVAPTAATLAPNATQQFNATVKDACNNTLTTPVSWVVTSGGGSISTSGLFTAGTTPGTFTNTVRATSGSVFGTASVTISSAPVATVEVTPVSGSVQINGSQQFTAVAKDASGNVVPASFTWSVVAGGGTINGSGLFTAGTATGTFTNTVRATSGSINGYASVTVTPGPLATITVTPATATLAVNGAQQFVATGKDAGGNTVPATVTWSVVAGGGTITSGGMFTAGTTPGTFTNTVRATSGSISGYASVTVQAGAIATITVAPATTTLSINGTQQFTATARDAAGNTVPATITWSVVAGGGSINSTGLFTAGTTPGTFASTVRATSGSISGYASVTVQAGALASIQVTPSTATLAVNGTQQFTAVGKDSAGNTVPATITWSVVAGGGTISSGGLFTAGTTPGAFANTVRATSGSISGTASVTVSAGTLASITISPSPASVAVTSTQQFTAVGKDAAGNTVPATITWSVIGGGGTIHTTSGLFTAGTAAGTFAGTVKATSGAISSTATVTVTPGPVQTVTVTPATVTMTVRSTRTFTASAKDAHGNTVTATPTWSVANSTAGSISTAGLFTAGGTAGSYPGAVVATIGSVTGSADVTLNPGALSKVVVSPANANITAGGVVQFSATGEDADGNIVAITPSWTALNGVGTITPAGALTATQVPGSYPNSVRAVANGVTGTASVSVSSGTLATIAISPANPTVAIGGTVTFTARGYDAFNNEILGLSPAWSVIGGAGTIDAAGTFTAGEESGTFATAVQATVGSVSGTTGVTISADFDGDGLPDAWELAHGLDPNNANDKDGDPDEDLLPNSGELTAKTDPNDADSDDDGALDGRELRPAEDTDNDGLTNALDADSDGDGLNDGLEMAVTSAHADTDTAKGNFVADADSATNTDPLIADTDGDGKKDGEEDANHNGYVDSGETDPNVPDTFCSQDAQCGSGNVCSASGVCQEAEAPASGCGCGATSQTGAFALALLALAMVLRARRRGVMAAER